MFFFTKEYYCNKSNIPVFGVDLGFDAALVLFGTAAGLAVAWLGWWESERRESSIIVI